MFSGNLLHCKGNPHAFYICFFRNKPASLGTRLQCIPIINSPYLTVDGLELSPASEGLWRIDSHLYKPAAHSVPGLVFFWRVIWDIPNLQYYPYSAPLWQQEAIPILSSPSLLHALSDPSTLQSLEGSSKGIQWKLGTIIVILFYCRSDGGR